MDAEAVYGVPLNPILYMRAALTLEEAVAACIMRRDGEKYHIIAARLGTNTHRLGEVFRGERHPEARALAAAQV
ncbi:hypothetical protein [uncultured Zoogloea sp.]|uniref:hypothetical protein n=1 Tax=uncultured Zoogloea sp. TaxID=160237 RepID=UPI002632F985|nr:hypothetical protein [uncultured Zoogloea sp.]